ncbi:bifunctional diguanylate cyclase/phosphodiesterase [Billgrantia sp. Q4P2]|uniref:bifunctional diguanylate cyclase/phosphodiesterase n=1 Tax=Billgrantia sp. Q4P2 TaxID=3463857 RepID=UPI004056F9FB
MKEKIQAGDEETTLTRLMTLERENELLRNMAERATDFVILVHDATEQGRIMFANDAACKHFGTDKATLLSWTPFDFDPTCDVAAMKQLTDKMQAGESVTFESEHRRASGELVSVEVVVHPFEQDGRLLGVSYIHDIRERRKMEAQRLNYEAVVARKEVEEHYRSLVETLPDFIVRLDTQARYVYVNPSMLNGIGRAEDAFLGRTAIEAGVMGSPDSDSRLYQKALHAVESREANVYQDWMVLAERKVCYEIRHIPEQDGDGNVVSVLGIARDVTEQVKIDDALRFIAQRNWSLDGEPFLSALARYLGEKLDVDYILIDRLADNPNEAETVAIFAKGELRPNVHYTLKGTPCENVMGGVMCCYPNDVRQRFPDDEMLAEMGVESYIGLPLWDSTGKVIGLITVMDGRPINDEAAVTGLLQLVATRAAAELERERSELALRAREREYRRLLDDSPDVIILYDNDCRRTYSNAAHRKTLTKPASVGATPMEEWGLPTGMDVAEAYQAHLRKVLDSGMPGEWELAWNDTDGNPVCFLVRGTPEFDSHGKIAGVLVVGRDISERLRLEKKLRHQATYDALTGLPNRWLAGERLREELTKAEHAGGSVALLFIDLDRFKEVNDTLGHEFGDQLLVEAAQRIQSCVRRCDVVARLGGDEFVVILPGAMNVAGLDDTAQKIITALMRPYTLAERQAYISASIGIATYPCDAGNADVLLACADQAMYKAKEQGRNGFRFFTPSMQAQTESRIRLANDLRSALSQKQFQVHFQPILDTVTGQVVKTEALLRWQHPEHGMVPPDLFIPVAEDTGIIHDIGDWVFREAVKMASCWRERCPAGRIQVSVNISPRQFMHEKMVGALLGHLVTMNVPGECIAIEITEGLLLDDQDHVREKLFNLREAGIRVALDDFGTGYSAMAYLKKFNIDYLKIDRSFVRDLARDESDRAIAETIVIMAKRLGMKTIAEGVETVEQRNILAAVNCEYVQGYLYSHPLPAAAFLEYITAGIPKESQKYLSGA